MENFQEQLLKTLEAVGNSEGVLGDDFQEATMVTSTHMDSYLAVKVFVMMIEAGDIEVKVVGNSLGKKDYLEKLLK